MFRCPITKKVSSPGEGMHKVIVEVKPATYKNLDADGIEFESYGTEIVKELCCSAEGERILRERGEIVEIERRIRVRKPDLSLVLREMEEALEREFE